MGIEPKATAKPTTVRKSHQKHYIITNNLNHKQGLQCCHANKFPHVGVTTFPLADILGTRLDQEIVVITWSQILLQITLGVRNCVLITMWSCITRYLLLVCAEIFEDNYRYIFIMYTVPGRDSLSGCTYFAYNGNYLLSFQGFWQDLWFSGKGHFIVADRVLVKA